MNGYIHEQTSENYSIVLGNPLPTLAVDNAWTGNIGCVTGLRMDFDTGGLDNLTHRFPYNLANVSTILSTFCFIIFTTQIPVLVLSQ
jgi:hypothetical protein